MTRFVLATWFLAAIAVGQAAEPAGPIPVTVDNFARAESDLYFGNVVKEGGFGKFAHRREPATIENQAVIRLNRDTLYSSAVFDFDAGPLTVTLPDAGERLMSMMVVNQDHYVQAVYYGATPRVLDKELVGTRYGLVAIRTFVDPADPRDVKKVHKLQDAISVTQPGGPGEFSVPAWDAASQKKLRDALLVLASTTSGFDHAFGKKGEVDPVRHLMATAAGWGGNPDADARYVGVNPERNDGKTIYVLTVKDVPVDGFWSVSVYNAQGYFEENALNAYSLNNITAKKGKDGSVRIQFGGCDGKVPNCLVTAPGWNYTVRLYRPRSEILDGTWKFPDAQPVN
jgi:hypothetical protein